MNVKNIFVMPRLLLARPFQSCMVFAYSSLISCLHQFHLVQIHDVGLVVHARPRRDREPNKPITSWHAYLTASTAAEEGDEDVERGAALNAAGGSVRSLPPLDPAPGADDFSAIFRRRTAWVWGAKSEIITSTMADDSGDPSLSPGQRQALASARMSSAVEQPDEVGPPSKALATNITSTSTTPRRPPLRLTDFVASGRCSSKLWNWWAVDELQLPSLVTAEDLRHEVQPAQEHEHGEDDIDAAASAAEVVALQVERCQRAGGRSYAMKLRGKVKMNSAPQPEENVDDLSVSASTSALGDTIPTSTSTGPRQTSETSAARFPALTQGRFLLCVPAACGETPMSGHTGMFAVFVGLHLRYLTSPQFKSRLEASRRPSGSRGAGDAVDEDDAHQPRAPQAEHDREFYLPISVLESAKAGVQAELFAELKTDYEIAEATALVTVSVTPTGERRGDAPPIVAVSHEEHIWANTASRFCSVSTSPTTFSSNKAHEGRGEKASEHHFEELPMILDSRFFSEHDRNDSPTTRNNVELEEPHHSNTETEQSAGRALLNPFLQPLVANDNTRADARWWNATVEAMAWRVVTKTRPSTAGSAVDAFRPSPSTSPFSQAFHFDFDHVPLRAITRRKKQGVGSLARGGGGGGKNIMNPATAQPKIGDTVMQKIFQVRNSTAWKHGLSGHCNGFLRSFGYNCLREENDLGFDFWEQASVQTDVRARIRDIVDQNNKEQKLHEAPTAPAAQLSELSKRLSSLARDRRRSGKPTHTPGEGRTRAAAGGYFAIMQNHDLTAFAYDHEFKKKRSLSLTKRAGGRRVGQENKEDTKLAGYAHSEMNFWRANKRPLDVLDALLRRVLRVSAEERPVEDRDGAAAHVAAANSESAPTHDDYHLGLDRVLALPSDPVNYPLSPENERELTTNLRVTIRRDWSMRDDILAHYHDSHFFANFATKNHAYNINTVFPFRILCLLQLAHEYVGGVLALDSEYHILQPFKLLQLFAFFGSQENLCALLPGPPLHFSFVVCAHLSWNAGPAVQEAWRKIVVRVIESGTGVELFPPRYVKEFLPAKRRLLARKKKMAVGGRGGRGEQMGGRALAAPQKSRAQGVEEDQDGAPADNNEVEDGGAGSVHSLAWSTDVERRIREQREAFVQRYPGRVAINQDLEVEIAATRYRGVRLDLTKTPVSRVLDVYGDKMRGRDYYLHNIFGSPEPAQASTVETIGHDAPLVALFRNATGGCEYYGAGAEGMGIMDRHQESPLGAHARLCRSWNLQPYHLDERNDYHSERYSREQGEKEAEARSLRDDGQVTALYRAQRLAGTLSEVFLRLGHTDHDLPANHLLPVGGNNIYAPFTGLAQGLSGYILSEVLPYWDNRRERFVEWENEMPPASDDPDRVETNRTSRLVIRGLPMCRWGYMVHMEDANFWCDDASGPPIMVHKPDVGVVAYLDRWVKEVPCTTG